MELVQKRRLELEAKRVLCGAATAYEVLGLEDGEDEDDRIQDRYTACRERWLSKDVGKYPNAKSVASKMEEAFETIATQTKRREYDSLRKRTLMSYTRGVSAMLLGEDAIYGRIIKPLLRVRGKLEVGLPTILVIGMESEGKSSLLERLTWRKVFPKGETYCTRVPIRLQLRHSAHEHLAIVRVIDTELRKPIPIFKTSPQPPFEVCQDKPEEGTTGQDCDPTVDTEFKIQGQSRESMDTAIVALVTSTMQTLLQSRRPGNDVRSVLCKEEIQIEIRGPDMPSLDFIDLPGIVQYPLGPAKDTADITKRYLAEEKNSVIIAVVSGTSQNMKNNTMWRVLRERVGQSSNNTRVLVAMTMVDQPGSEKNFAARLAMRADLLFDVGMVHLIPVINCWEPDQDPESTSLSFDESIPHDSLEEGGLTVLGHIQAGPDSREETGEMTDDDVRRFGSEFRRETSFLQDICTQQGVVFKPEEMGVGGVLYTLDKIFRKHILDQWIATDLLKTDADKKILATEKKNLGREPSTVAWAAVKVELEKGQHRFLEFDTNEMIEQEKERLKSSYRLPTTPSSWSLLQRSRWKLLIKSGLHQNDKPFALLHSQLERVWNDMESLFITKAIMESQPPVLLQRFSEIVSYVLNFYQTIYENEAPQIHLRLQTKLEKTLYDTFEQLEDQVDWEHFFSSWALSAVVEVADAFVKGLFVLKTQYFRRIELDLGENSFLEDEETTLRRLDLDKVTSSLDQLERMVKTLSKELSHSHPPQSLTLQHTPSSNVSNNKSISSAASVASNSSTSQRKERVPQKEQRESLNKERHREKTFSPERNMSSKVARSSDNPEYERDTGENDRNFRNKRETQVQSILAASELSPLATSFAPQASYSTVSHHQARERTQQRNMSSAPFPTVSIPNIWGTSSGFQFTHSPNSSHSNSLVLSEESPGFSSPSLRSPYQLYGHGQPSSPYFSHPSSTQQHGQQQQQQRQHHPRESSRDASVSVSSRWGGDSNQPLSSRSGGHGSTSASPHHHLGHHQSSLPSSGHGSDNQRHSFFHHSQQQQQNVSPFGQSESLTSPVFSPGSALSNSSNNVWGMGPPPGFVIHPYQSVSSSSSSHHPQQQQGMHHQHSQSQQDQQHQHFFSQQKR